MSAPTHAEVEALARALCLVRRVDPDTRIRGTTSGKMWWRCEAEARAHLEIQAAAAMVAIEAERLNTADAGRVDEIPAHDRARLLAVKLEREGME